MKPDPLVVDVLCDPRTINCGNGNYMRDGVVYEFTFEELETAQRLFRERIKELKTEERVYHRPWPMGNV
jgi:hypothetical protein